MLRATRITALLVACTLPPAIACADPRLPQPHHGKSQVIARWSFGNTAFRLPTFGAARKPASCEYESLSRYTGTYGLSRNWAIEYDLRAAETGKSGHGYAQNARGFQDQLIGIERGLHQGARFADAVSLNVLIPTGAKRAALGSGVMALQPGYEAEIRGNGPHTPFASLTIALRMYSGGFGSQWRASAQVGERITPRIEASGLLAYYRSTSALTVGPAAYDELRAGVELKRTSQSGVRPFLRYEQDIAGRNVHAMRRISFGLEFKH